MRARTDIALKERRKFTLTDFRGVDLSSSPLRVHASRASHAVNWIRERGTVQKRHGWSQLLSQIKNKKTVTGADGSVTTVYEPAPINGIFPYRTQNGSTELLICAGSELGYAYLMNGGYAYRKIDFSWALEQNCRVQSFIRGEKIYLVGGGRYLCYDCTTHKAADVVPYIPTTTQSIDPVGEADSVRKSLDAPNLLTRQRKNLLVGSPKSLTDSCKWNLDGAIAHNSTVRVTVTLQDADGNEVIQTYTSGMKEGQDPDRLYNSNNNHSGGVSRDFGQINLNRVNTTPPIENESNITVEFTAASGGGFSEDVIGDCRFGTVFGIDGAEDRLFLSGNPAYPNTVFFSESDRFNYFPEPYTATFGTAQSAVTGFLRLSDDVQAVFKEKTANEASVYYQTGRYQTTYTDAGEVERITPIFSITAGAASECAVSPWGIANFAGDSMFVSDRGVFALELAENLATNVRSVRERGRTVEKHLCRRDLRDAVSVVHDGKYYLAADGFCYVADSRCRYQPDDSPSYNYEWWLWDNIPARVFAVVNGDLWFGTDDGRVCCFGNGYTDRTFDVIPAGDVTVDFDHNCMVYAPNIKVHENDKIRLPDAGDHSLWRSYATDFALMGDHVRFKLADPAEVVNIFEGDTVDFIDKTESATYTTKDLCIGEVDRLHGTFTLVQNGETVRWIDMSAPTPPGDLDGGYYSVLYGTPTLVKKLVGEYHITEIGSVEVAGDGYTTRQTFQIKESAEDDSPVLTLSNVLGVSYDDMTLIFEHPVVALWQTPLFDFGDNTASKTLLSLTLAQDAEALGTLAFGFETRSTAWEREMQGVGAFSFEDLNFHAFTLETGFQSSFTARVRENFNYIQFRFWSDSPSPCSLGELAALYKINKRKRGVM